MKNFIIHDTLGQILRTGSCPDSMVADQLQPGETAIEGAANDLTQYIAGGIVTNKPAIGAVIDKTTVTANGIDFCTISGLPNPSHISVIGGGASIAADVIDGAIELTFDTPGAYRVRCESINKLPAEILIDAS